MNTDNYVDKGTYQKDGMLQALGHKQTSIQSSTMNIHSKRPVTSFTLEQNKKEAETKYKALNNTPKEQSVNIQPDKDSGIAV